MAELSAAEELGREQVLCLAHRYLGEYYNAHLAKTQIAKFRKEGTSLEDMAFALRYFYEVQKNDPAASRGGIGIIPFVLGEAKEYYARLQELEEQAESRAVGVDIAAAKRPAAKVAYVRRQPISRPRSWNSFDLN